MNEQNQRLCSTRSEFCSIDRVSKCLTVPENGMNIDSNVVKYSDVDFSKKFETK